MKYFIKSEENLGKEKRYFLGRTKTMKNQDGDDIEVIDDYYNEIVSVEILNKQKSALEDQIAEIEEKIGMIEK